MPAVGPWCGVARPPHAVGTERHGTGYGDALQSDRDCAVDEEARRACRTNTLQISTAPTVAPRCLRTREQHLCPTCGGVLLPRYDLDAIPREVSRDAITARPHARRGRTTAVGVSSIYAS